MAKLLFAIAAVLPWVSFALVEQHSRSQVVVHASELPGVHVALAAKAGVTEKIRGFLAKRSLAEPVIAEDEDVEALSDFKETFLLSTVEVVITFVIWLVFYTLAAAYYHHYVRCYVPPDEKVAEEEKGKNYEDLKNWTTGLCECSKHPGITFWSFCCPFIRWADTASKTGIHAYWPAFCCVTLLQCISFIPVATWLVWLLVVFYMTYHRQEIRARFEFQDKFSGGVMCGDCCSYFWCFCCTIAQDGRQCRDAMIAGSDKIKHSPRGSDETSQS